MSRRHHDGIAALTRQELRAHRRSARHRTKASLAELADLAADDTARDGLDEPADPMVEVERRGFRPPNRRSRYAHWKQPFWKRRSTLRARRARAWHLA